MVKHPVSTNLYRFRKNITSIKARRYKGPLGMLHSSVHSEGVLRMQIVSLLLAILVTVGLSCGQGESNFNFTNLDDGYVSSEIVNMAMKCYDNSTKFAFEFGNAVQNLNDLGAIQNVQTGLSVICEMCLNDVTLKSETYQNEIYHNIFLIFRDFIEASLTIGPHEDLRVLAALLYGNHTLSEKESNASPLLRCLENYGAKMNTLLAMPALGPAGQMLVLYYETMHLRNCLEEQRRGDSYSKFWMRLHEHLGTLTGNMTCVNPGDEYRYLCSKIPAEKVWPTGAPFCPGKRMEGVPQTIDTIGRQLLSCLLGTEPEGDEEVRDVNWYRNFYREQCRDKVMLKRCIHSATVMSWVCLGQSERQMIQLGAESLLRAVEVGCLDDGESLAVLSADISKAVMNTSDRNGKYDDCTFSFKERNDESDENEDINPWERRYVDDSGENDNGLTIKLRAKLEFYKQFRLIKNCLTQNHTEDKIVSSYMQILLDEMLKGILCFHAASDKYIPCSIIDILLQEERETMWQDVYSEFIRMGLSCINMHINVSYFNSMSTLDEHQVVFAGYCKREDFMKQCLSDMTTYTQNSLQEYIKDKYHKFIDMMNVFIKTICTHGGKHLTSIVFAMDKQKEALGHCWNIAYNDFINDPVEKSTSDSINSKSLTTMKELAQCIRSNYKNRDKNITRFVEDMEYIEMTARCVHKGFLVDFCLYNAELRKNCTTRYCFITTGAIIF